ncbi:MAG: hypothetical protein D6816_17885 [Bacteroidetes bacterium]|nr:MAG: hypothetical protein D6816_17885 [Bacteroidota bacterium]
MKKFVLVAAALCLLIGTAVSVLAFPVDTLPPDNLIDDPWLLTGLAPAGWHDEAGDYTYLTWSFKDKNPAPAPETVGGGLRFANGIGRSWGNGEVGGEGRPNTDIVAYKIVASPANATTFTFFTWFVAAMPEDASINIYGGSSDLYTPGDLSNWTLLARPFWYENGQSSHAYTPLDWTPTGFQDYSFSQDYPFYLIRVHVRYINNLGMKFTGIGIWDHANPEVTATFTPPPTATPTNTPTLTPTPVPTSTPLPSATATFTPQPPPTATATAVPSTTPLPTTTATFTPQSPPTATATAVPSTTPLPTATATFTPQPPPTATATAVPSATPLPTATATKPPAISPTKTPAAPNLIFLPFVAAHK